MLFFLLLVAVLSSSTLDSPYPYLEEYKANLLARGVTQDSADYAVWLISLVSRTADASNDCKEVAPNSPLDDGSHTIYSRALIRYNAFKACEQYMDFERQQIDLVNI